VAGASGDFEFGFIPGSIIRRLLLDVVDHDCGLPLFGGQLQTDAVGEKATLSILRILRSGSVGAHRASSVGFLAGNVGSVSGFLEEPDISYVNRISRLGRKCREGQVFLG
jgi:hypothetical protein